MLRIPALASSVVASICEGLALQQAGFNQSLQHDVNTAR
jgi:hypothetical protein